MPATKKRKVKPTAKAKANMIFRNCGICRKNCKIASICCDNCDTWYHLRCEELELADYEMFLTEKKLNYSCKGCFSHDQSDEYTYTSALLRLTEAGEQEFNYLRFCCKREKGMLPTMTEAEYSEEKLAVYSEHSTSKLLLKQYKMNENGERFLVL
ncbi:uncharacterized protein [Mytilus edulis]|uniref:uncharacterized protein n=1 Tax=Mytilus edulis TaxID=6550 RepID=UPI0039F07CF1